ncbi:hypothetical protein LOAG_06496 [Loa loa]|uniref:Uncharacterized protein n=1 Tax=Loa loa TaxID=7209 RepID=A0A1S0TXU7_LOALO|nr:hypothetical protein LOAG_06496 [Loa loa]EFO21991.1 hypothetical protein LOAG_06496 [Loa loa]
MVPYRFENTLEKRETKVEKIRNQEEMRPIRGIGLTCQLLCCRFAIVLIDRNRPGMYLDSPLGGLSEEKGWSRSGKYCDEHLPLSSDLYAHYFQVVTNTYVSYLTSIGVFKKVNIKYCKNRRLKSSRKKEIEVVVSSRGLALTESEWIVAAVFAKG